MARRPKDVIPVDVMEFARLLEVPPPDWYVRSAESGRGASLAALLREAADVEGDRGPARDEASDSPTPPRR